MVTRVWAKTFNQQSNQGCHKRYTIVTALWALNLAMWNPFKSKSLLSEDDHEFQIETYKWLLKHFGGDGFFTHALLVLPNRDFFPDVVDSEEEAASKTFEMVKLHAGMKEWPCTLIAQEPDPERRVDDALLVQGGGFAANGTFRVDEKNKITITYNPDIVSNPTQLVATFAHELSHYLTASSPEPPPGGWDNWEFATDICAVFLGFGVFMANSAFQFRQYNGPGTQGWQVRSNGYLSEAELAYSLGLFLGLKDIEVSTVVSYLDQSVRSKLKRALSNIHTLDEIQKLKRVEYVPKGS